MRVNFPAVLQQVHPMLPLAGCWVNSSAPKFLWGGQLTSISVSSTSSIVLPNHGAGPNLATTANCEELGLPFCPHIFGSKSPMPSPSWPTLLSCQCEVQGLLSHDLEPVRVRAMSPALMTPGTSLLATAGSKMEKGESITHAPMASHTSGVAQALSCSCSQGTLTCHLYCVSKMRYRTSVLQMKRGRSSSPSLIPQ